LRRIPYIQQPRFDVVYKGVNVGAFIPDLVVFDNIIVDTKTIDHIANHEVGQVMNYLRLSNKKLGLILNFKYSKSQWKRIVF
jgi:GxxExxY protein